MFVCVGIIVVLITRKSEFLFCSTTRSARYLLCRLAKFKVFFYLGHCSLVMSVQDLCGPACRLLLENKAQPALVPEHHPPHCSACSLSFIPNLCSAQDNTEAAETQLFPDRGASVLHLRHYSLPCYCPSDTIGAIVANL